MLMIEMLVNNLVSAAKMVGYATSGHERSSHLNAVEDARKLLLDAIAIQSADARLVEAVRAAAIAEDAYGCGFYGQDDWISAYSEARSLAGVPYGGDTSRMQVTRNWKLMPPAPDDGMLNDAMVAVRAVNFIVDGEPPRKPEVQERILLNAAYTAMFNRAPVPVAVIEP